MTRPLTLSNGRLHVGLDEHALINDVYYPHVGLENHVAGHVLHHRLGVWVDGAFSWLEDDGWTFDIRLDPHALVGTTVATNDALKVRLELTDAVYSAGDAFLRSILVWNLADIPREVRLFTHAVFAIGDSRSNTDTAQYLPENDAVLHYRGRRAFVIGGRTAHGAFDAHSIGLYGIEGHEGTFRDAEDGELGGNAVEHGRVDSVLGFHVPLGAHDSGLVDYWISAGTGVTDALRLHESLRQHGTHGYLSETARYWRRWLEPAEKRFAAVDGRYRDAARRSLLILKSQFDHDGAVIASTDTTMLNYSRDAYGYCWPRDGALACWPLIRLGYTDEPLAFFRFVARVIHPGGYLMHKYFADGSLGPSWHPYVHGTAAGAPIQEDETATVLFMLAEFVAATDDNGLLEEFYDRLIAPMAGFICGFVDERSGLPRPSYDPWEEVFATGTYTTASAYGALIAASDLAERHGRAADALRWRSEAESLQKAAHATLFNHERGFFYKSVTVGDDGETVRDTTVDSASLYGALAFGLYPHDSAEVRTSIRTLGRTLAGGPDDASDATPEGYGIARYEDDDYNRNGTSGVGNPWFITSLWQAQAALYQGDREAARTIVDWVTGHMAATGVLAEQADRRSGAPISVAPLAWSQAEFINTVLDLGAAS